MFNKVVVMVTADDPVIDASSSGSSSVGGGDYGGEGAAQPPPTSGVVGGPMTCTTREISISTGEALCFGVNAFRPYNDPLNMVRIVACIGDEVLLYGIPLVAPPIPEEGGSGSEEDATKEEEAILLGKTNVGKGYGANVTTYSPLQQNGQLVHSIAVGCENGMVMIYQLNQTGPQSFEFIKMAECQGHTKALCAVNFHPRGHQLLSSAKDGSARIFDVSSGNELAVLKCDIHDPKGPPPVEPKATMKTKDPRMMKRPPMILVRGCAYGDLEGKVIYTVASGKRGPAYLTRWKTSAVQLNNTAGSSSGPPGQGPPPTTTGGEQKVQVTQQYRIQCSPVPISASSLSADGTLFTFGSVEGSIILYNVETRSVLKEFKEVHDLPVTCVASRPVPNLLMLPGELEEGVNFDAVSASADNKLGRWTLQKKSRIAKPRSASSSRNKSALERYLWELFRVPLLLMLLLMVIALRDTVEICSEEFGLNSLVMDPSRASHCLYREVLWAEEGRVSFVPE